MKDNDLLGQEGDMESSRPEQVPWTLTVGSEWHREASGPVVSSAESGSSRRKAMLRETEAQSALLISGVTATYHVL